MRLRLGLALAMVIACGDSGGDSPSDKSQDAGAPEDANIDARSPPLDARIQDSEPEPVGPLDAAQLPAIPSSLSVQLQTTACLGTCPVYKIRVDLTGRVSFVGGSCSARPGVYAKMIEPAAVQTFYDTLRASPYFSLQNSYADTTICPTLLSDAPGQIWDVNVEGTRKLLSYDQGCEGVPALDQIDPLAARLAATSEVQAWVGDGQVCELFRGDAVLGELATRYRIARDGKPLALLEFKDDETFVLSNCSGTVVGTGFSRRATYSAVLIDQLERKMKFGELEFGSIVLLRPSDNEAIVAYGLREDDELRLAFVEADGCTAQ